MIIIETGQAAPDSVAYCSVADADAYHAARGVAAWAVLTTEQKEQAIVRGCDFLTQTYRNRWAGIPASSTQALDWPRYYVPHHASVASVYPHDSVPRELVYANAEAAIRAASGELIEDLDQQVQTEEVGPLKTVYFKAESRGKKYPVIDKMIAHLLCAAQGLRLVRA